MSVLPPELSRNERRLIERIESLENHINLLTQALAAATQPATGAKCILCGHDDVNMNGVCGLPLAKVPSSGTWIDTHCGCKCEFATGEEAGRAEAICKCGMPASDTIHSASSEFFESHQFVATAAPVPAVAEWEPPELGAAVNDLLGLMEQDSRGMWCFTSLSRDGAKFQAAIERLAAARQPTTDVNEIAQRAAQKIVDEFAKCFDEFGYYESAPPKIAIIIASEWETKE